MFPNKSIMQVKKQSSCRCILRVRSSFQIRARAVPLVLVLLLGCSRLVTVTCRPQEATIPDTLKSNTNSSLATSTTISSIPPTVSPSTSSSTPAGQSTNENATTTITHLLPLLNRTDAESTVPVSSAADAPSPSLAPTNSTVKNRTESESEPKSTTVEEIPKAAAATATLTTTASLNSTATNATAPAGPTAADDDGMWEFDERGFRKCNAANSSALNKCLRLIVQDLRPRLRNGFGIPELNIPPLDPLRLRSVSFEHGSGPIKVIATFKNVVAMGLGHLNKTDFEVDIKRRVLDYDLEIPQMQIIGEYELSGNLFFFPVGGKGNFAVNLQRITAKGQGKLGIVILNNRKTVQMNKIDIDLDIANVKVHLTNLFNGDPVWGTVINKFLNDNSKDIFEEIRPKIAMQVSELVKSVSNRALGLLGADHFADVRNTKVDVL